MPFWIAAYILLALAFYAFSIRSAKQDPYEESDCDESEAVSEPPAPSQAVAALNRFLTSPR